MNQPPVQIEEIHTRHLMIYFISSTKWNLYEFPKFTITFNFSFARVPRSNFRKYTSTNDLLFIWSNTCENKIGKRKTYSSASRCVYRSKIFAKSISEITSRPLLNSWNSSSRTSCCRFSMKHLKFSYFSSLVPSFPKKCTIRVVSIACRRCKPWK